MLSDKIVELLNKITRYHVMSIASNGDTVGYYIECNYEYYGIDFRIEDSCERVRFSRRINIRALNEETVTFYLKEILGACVEYFGELDNEQ